MKKLFIFTVMLIMIIGLTFSAAAYPSYNMSWSFNKFNNPDARQAAINIAETQDDLVETDQNSIDRFTEGLERRLYSSVQRQIIEDIMESEDPTGEFTAGDLEISVTEGDGEVFVEITDSITGESTTVTYSNDWGNLSN
ncbi:MAG: curli assembly protein CsgF [Bacillota bacterium]